MYANQINRLASLLKIDTAVVLVGGPGSRLSPLTEKMPKALVKVGSKPLLQWILEWLRHNDVRHVILGVAHLKDDIIHHFDDGNRYGLDIEYSVHTVEGGTGEGFRLAISKYVNDEVFFALNGDQITDLDLHDLAFFHLRNNPTVTMAVTKPYCPFGHVEVDDNANVLRFIEKPTCALMVCNAGIYVFNHGILPYLPEKGDIEQMTLPLLAKRHRLRAYLHNGLFITVNTPKDLETANDKLRRLRL